MIYWGLGGNREGEEAGRTERGKRIFFSVGANRKSVRINSNTLSKIILWAHFGSNPKID